MCIILGVIVFLLLASLMGRRDRSPFLPVDNYSHDLPDIVDSLERRGIDVFAYSNTLLGCMRHQGYIPWDDGRVTLCVNMEDKEKVISELKNSYEMKERYGNVLIASKSPEIHIQFYEILGTKITIPYSADAHPYTDIFPLRTMTFGERHLKVPNESLRVLSRAYGDDWRDVCVSKGVQVPCESLDMENPNVENVYVINLDRRPDKWNLVKRRFEKIGINPIRWKASWKEDDEVMRNKTPSISAAEAGCSTSHYKLIEYLYNETDLPYAFIAEDDAYPCQSLTRERIESEVRNSPGFDIIFIGYCIGRFSNRIETPVIGSSLCAHAYVISRRGMKSALEKKSFDMPIDHFFVKRVCGDENALCFLSENLSKCGDVKTFGRGLIQQDSGYRVDNDIDERA